MVGNELPHINIHTGLGDNQVTETLGGSLMRITWPGSRLQIKSNARPDSWHGKIMKGALNFNVVFLSRKGAVGRLKWETENF